MTVRKQKAVAFILAGCLVATPFSAYATGETDIATKKTKFQMFADVENHWGKAAIEFVVNNGIFNGTSATTFEPNGALTREQTAVILYNCAKSNKLNIEIKGEAIGVFPDVGDMHEWGKDGMKYCVENGIMLGSDGRLEPKGIVTKAQLAKMIFAFAKNAGYDVATKNRVLNIFYDSADIPKWAEEGMRYCLERGVLQGDNENYISPLASASRAEMATVMQRLAETVKPIK